MCDATAFLAFRSLCFKTVGCKSSGARVMSAHQNKKISMIAAYAKGMRGDTERPVLEWDCQRIRGRIGCFTPDLDPWGYFPRSCRSFVVQLLGCSLHCKRGEVGRRLTVRPCYLHFLVASERCRMKAEVAAPGRYTPVKRRTVAKAQGTGQADRNSLRKGKRRTPGASRKPEGAGVGGQIKKKK